MPDRPRFAQSVLDLVGQTPLVRLSRIGRDVPYPLIAKLEHLNPGGSVKDRIGAWMIDDAERRGLLKPGGTIVEATSGNTGVGLAMVAAVRGYRSIFVLPDKMSAEKIRLLRSYGARVIVTPSRLPPEHPMSNYSVARQLAERIPGAYYPNQYENPFNPEAHYRTTAPEIDAAVGAEVGAIVATIGTGGTVSGIGRYFKERRPNVRIVAVDPVGSVLAPYFRTKRLGPATPYLVEGIGEDMVPKTVQFQYLDEFVEVTDRESFEMARQLAREEGLFVGGSSGAAVQGALRWLERRPIPVGSPVVIILPDSGDRYLSTFYSDEWMREKGFLGGGATAGELVARKRGTPALVAVDPTALVRDALALLRHHQVSEAPVLSGVENVGRIREEEVLRRALLDETVLERTVSQVLEPPFPELSTSTTVGELLHRLRSEPTVLVRDPATQAPVGVLTRHDLVGYLSEEGASDAI